jgi:lectin-like protein
MQTLIFRLIRFHLVPWMSMAFAHRILRLAFKEDFKLRDCDEETMDLFAGKQLALSSNRRNCILGFGKVLQLFSVSAIMATNIYGQIIAWDASSGLLPSDGSIPADQRFVLNGDPAWANILPEHMNVVDDSTTFQFKFFKDDFGSISASSDWAYQIELRVNWSQPGVDHGGHHGIRDEGKDGFLLLDSDKVGFLSADGIPWSLSYALDTTDGFHHYRVTKTTGIVRLFVDHNDEPSLVFAYDQLLDNTSGPTRVDLGGTSNPGMTDFDVGYFSFNPSGTELPDQWLSEWIDHNGHRYRVTKGSTWSQAQDIAASVGGSLVTIDDSDENLWIMETLGSFATSPNGLWIGLFQRDGSQEPLGGWTWVSGDNADYRNWAAGSPNDNRINGNENVTRMFLPGTVEPAGKWDDIAEDHLLTGVVETIDPVWEIADGGNGHRYRPVAVPAGLSWTEASSLAIAAGGHLVTITSDAENEFVFSLVDAPEFWNVPGNYLGPWLGGMQPPGTDEPDGGWEWVTGESFAWYDNWLPGEPNDNAANDSDFLHFFSHDGRASTWNDRPDENSFPVVGYVVEFEPDCVADFVEPFGVLDIFDIFTFLGAFSAHGVAADLAEPYGVWDFFDVMTFLEQFAAGCP